MYISTRDSTYTPHSFNQNRRNYRNYFIEEAAAATVAIYLNESIVVLDTI